MAVESINPSINTNIKPNKGKKIGTALGLTTGLGVAGSVAYKERGTVLKQFNTFMSAIEKDTVNFTTKSGKAILKNVPKKTAAVLYAAAPIAGIALAATAAGAVIGRIGGAIADKIAAKKAQ